MMDTVQRWNAGRMWPLAVVVASALGLSAYLLAQSPPIHLLRSEAGTISIGQGLLVAGAIPWFLQWCSLAILFGAALRQFNFLDHGDTRDVLLMPLAIGATWWIGIIVTHWQDDPADFILSSIVWSRLRAVGNEPLTQFILQELFGPLTCPLTLQGPYRLLGWGYVWTALSTCVWFLLLAVASSVLKGKRLRSVRGALSAFGVALIFTMPILLRGLIRIVNSVPPT